MAYGNNDTEYEAGAPKKADVLIRSTQHIAMKQDELSEQTKQVASRLDEVAEMFAKNTQDSSYIVKQSGEIFSQLQTENSALKQELLYLAKQSENIYAGLAEKITELSEQAKIREDAFVQLADKINDVSEQTVKSGESYSGILDKLTELSEQNKRNERLISELSDKLASLSGNTKRSVAYGDPADKNEIAEAGGSQLLDKLNYISDQLRRSEGAHSMLADKFEILSMRVEQFGFESAKGASAYGRGSAVPAAYPVPAPAEVKAEIDYDKLAEKVADLLATREAISPDYIASKVAEQVVIPDVQTANVKVAVDTHDIARQVADLIDEKVVRVESASAPVPAPVEIDEDGLAEKIAQKLGGILPSDTPSVEIDEDELAEKIASKVGGMRVAPVAVPSSAPADIDEDELADSIAIKVGSLKAEDFEILVDDEGCASISKEITNNLDYGAISNIIADKLRDALDLASANAPDYEEMAERISERITVAGVNEAAIADKAAAALSNYLPEIDTDEIADKVTGAVIDVVSAIPQPTIDNEAICNAISERLISSQEDHDYDVVIDEDGISRITETISEEIENKTASRFDKVEEEIAKLSELLNKPEEVEEAEAEEVEENTAEEEVAEEEISAEPDYDKLKALLSEEIENKTASRFDKVDEDIAKLCELVSGAVVTDEEEYPEEEYEEEEYPDISEVVAAEIEKGVGSRLTGIEENVAKITEYLTADEETEEVDGQAEEEIEEEPVEDDYSALSEVVAAEIEKGIEGVAVRISDIEENVAKITEYLTAEAETEEEAEEDTEEVEEDYSAITEAVSAEIEKGVASRLCAVEENLVKVEESIIRLSEQVATVSNSDGKTEDDKEYVEIDDCTVLSDVIAAEIEKGVASRLSGIEENITKVGESVATISEHINAEQIRTAKGIVSRVGTLEEHIVAEQVRTAKGIVSRIGTAEENITKAVQNKPAAHKDGEEDFEEVADYATLSKIVAEEIERGIAFRLDGIEENINKLAERADEDCENKEDGRIDKVCGDVAEIKEMLSNGAVAVSETAAAQNAVPLAEEEETEDEELVKVSDLVEPEDEEEPVEEVTAEPAPAPVSEPVRETVREVKEFVKEKETVREVLIQPVFVPVGESEKTERAESVPEKQPENLEEFEEDEEEDDDDDFSIDVLDMDAFADDELMPGELSDYADGVDFENMMKYKRSFIARIIQSNDENKQYYGEVKHALLSYKRVNSNVAWGAERFNKGRETIARMKIRGKTLCLYLALDPENYKTSVYHHLNVSDNKSVEGTPMMVKIKSNLGVRKAIRLIDEMLALRGGEKKDIPERDYAAMYPYETIEELIDDGLVKDVRKK